MTTHTSHYNKKWGENGMKNSRGQALVSIARE